MGTKVIAVPTGTLEVQDTEGRPLERRNIFVHLMGVLVENTPQKSETDTYLAHSIREKLDALSRTLKDHSEENGHENQNIMFALEEAEIQFLKQGLELLRRGERMTGSAWYYVLSPLSEAKVKEKETG